MAELKGLVGGHISVRSLARRAACAHGLTCAPAPRPQVVTSKGDEFQTDTYFPANPTDVDQSDHTALLHLSDATLLHNTRMRYLRDDIYTYVGPILVSVNPFKYIPKLYAPELMADCKRFPPGHPQRPPHTFSMAEAAYMQAGGKYGHSRCGHSRVSAPSPSPLLTCRCASEGRTSLWWYPARAVQGRRK